MIELTPQTPAAAAELPFHIGAFTLEELPARPMSLLMPHPGGQAQMAQALMAGHGLIWPAPGGHNAIDGAEAVWFGLDQVMLIGVAPDPALMAAGSVIGQSDAWCVLRLSGTGWEDVMARLAPVDMRPAALSLGRALRSQLGHMNAAYSLLPDGALRIMVFRSMAQTAVHELTRAMTLLAARAE